ncbi:MAG: hypothetical protein ED559_11980 [Phycisphaera sp.]|nr:MAG: hypothetical protein ED559_11980 [Phycisphaera sp.]
MIQFFLNNIQLLIFLLILAGPILGKLGEWLLKQKAMRDQQAEMRRREEEELRTGRVSEPAAKQPTPEELEAMIAEQLRQQREEMMRQRAEQAEARRKAAQERAEAARKKQEQLKQQEQAAPKRERMRAAHPRPAPLTPSAEQVSMAGIVPASRRASAAPAQRARGTALVGNIDADSLRKAIVMNEILSPPISIREEGESLF